MAEKCQEKRLTNDLKEILNLISQPVLVVDQRCIFVCANKVFEVMVGEKLSEIVGKPLDSLSFFNPELKALLAKMIAKRLQGEKIDSYEITFIIDGKTRYFEPTGKRIDYLGTPADLIILNDVTERTQLQKKLVEKIGEEKEKLFLSESKIKSILDLSPDAVAFCDMSGNVVECNQAMVELFRFETKDQLIGKHWRELISKDSYSRATEAIEQINSVGLISNVELTLSTPNGEEILTIFSGKRLDGSSGLAIGFVAVAKDITEHKRIEKSLKQRLQCENAISKVSSRFVSSFDFDAAVYSSLGDIGKLCGTSRGSIFLLNKNKENTITNIYEWCADGVNSLKIIRQNIPVKDFSWLNKLRKEGSICIDDVSKMPQEVKAQRESLEKCGVKSIIVLPLYIANELEGFLVFDNVKSTGQWSQENIGVLRIYSEIVGAAIGGKRTLDALQKSEKRFADISSNVNEAIWEIDTDGRILYYSSTIEQILGYLPTEVIGKYFYDFFLPKEREQNKDIAFQAFASAKHFSGFISQNQHKNGSTVILETSGIPVFDSVGKVIGYRGAHRDVTDVKKTQNALRESKERFHGIANSARDAIILVDEQAVVTYWNPAAEKIFGYTNKEVIGKTVHELVVPDSMCKEGKDRIATSVKTFTHTGMGYFTVGNVELIGRRKDGSEFPAELAISPIKLRGKWNAVGIVKDVTKRKQAEQKLREAEQRYHALFNQAPLGVLVVDPETAGFVEFNDIAHQQLDYSREEFEKIKIFDIEAAESPTQVKAHLTQMVQEGGGEFETRQKTKNGETRNVLVTTKAFKSAGKTFLHSIFHDITESKKVQNSLIESEARYRQLVELAQEGILALDTNFTTVFVNPRMAQMLKYAESEMLGKSVFCFLDWNATEKVEQFLTKFRHDNKGQFEFPFQCKDGTRVYTNIALSSITDDQGQLIGTLAVVSDITKRKQAEKALKESEELSKAIVANAPIGIATADASLHFVTANEAFCKILGYTEDELRKLKFLETIHPDCLPESLQKINELKTGSISSFIQEKRYIKKDGTTIIGRVITNAIRDQKGQPTLFIAELEDVTKNRQLEDDLRASEERFRAISTSAMDAIILSDEEDRVIYWNPAAQRTFGFLESEAVGRKLADLVIPAHGHKKHCEMLKELSENPQFKRHYGFNALRKDGSTFPIDLSVVSVKLKDKKCLLSIVRDVTEWKAMEEALRRERDMLENMATSIDAGLTIIDKDYRIIWANQLLKQINGNNLENTFCYSAFDKSRKICPDCGVKKIFETGATVDRHDYHYMHDGRDEWVELIVTPVKDKDGKVIAALELAVNITERKRLQNKLAEYSQQLEELVQNRTEQLKKTQAELVKSERLAAIGELAGMVGHDLRNPLTGIKNSAYFLKKKGSDISPIQAQEMLETIDKCVDYSNKIINDLLDYSRQIRLNLQEESPKKLFAESLSLLDYPQKIKILNLLQDQPTITVDPDKIKRVFINLVKNAVDAMPNGGQITVDSKQVDGLLEVSFADTGAGIADDVLPKLFAPLFTTKAQGMGFGLAICKRIIEAHGGTISVKTAKDKGTTFTLTFPIESKLEIGGETTWINIPESS